MTAVATKKAIATAPAWTCENMDLLAPITRTFIMALFNTGEVAEYHGEPMATDDEIKAYAHSRGYVYKGDEIAIVKGRKYVGETKIVKGFYRYYVAGTYGHQYVDYLLFTDGTKVNQDNCRVTGYENVQYILGEFKGFYIGGRQ